MIVDPNPDERINLAVLLPTDIVGGHERMLMEWLRDACKLGLLPTIYCRRKAELCELIDRFDLERREEEYVVDRKDVLRLGQWRNFIVSWRRAKRLPFGTTVLLAPGAMQFGLVHLLACVVARRPVVCYVPIAHEAAVLGLEKPAVRDWLAARIASRVALWITVTDEQRQLLKNYWGIHAPIHVIPNRLALQSRAPAMLRTGGDSKHVLSVLYAGRFESNQKGLDWLVDVLSNDGPWMANMRFTFQGRGEFGPRIGALAARLGDGRIRVLPWGDIAESLRVADVFLLTSRFEGFPLVAIEAIWSGIPVVASTESGLSEVLPAECRFAFGDAAGLASALARMRSPDCREAALRQSRARLTALLSEERYAFALKATVDGIARMRKNGKLMGACR